MATITRGEVVLTPALVLPVTLTRAGLAVLHTIIGDPEPEITDREPALRRGAVRTLWPTPAAAAAAMAALAVTGGPWTIADSGDCDMVCKIAGPLSIEPVADGATTRSVVVEVQEVDAT